MTSAAFSAVAYTELTIFPLTLLGKTLASATLNPLTPFTRRRLSTASPIAQVPIGWYSERTQSLFPRVSAGLRKVPCSLPNGGSGLLDVLQINFRSRELALCNFVFEMTGVCNLVNHSQPSTEDCHICRMPEVTWVNCRMLCRICVCCQ